MKRSKHSLSHYRQTCDMGKLVPCGLLEVLPGDTFQHSADMLIRVSPMSAPVMHPVVARIHHWFVPHRLTWTDWEDFITGGPDGNNADTVPKHTSLTVEEGSPVDYLGVPPGATRTYSGLPTRAYGLVYNEFYRDQDLQTEIGITADFRQAADLQNIAWEKDYFTTSRPWAQKGTAVSIPADGS